MSTDPRHQHVVDGSQLEGLTVVFKGEMRAAFHAARGGLISAERHEIECGKQNSDFLDQFIARDREAVFNLDVLPKAKPVPAPQMVIRSQELDELCRRFALVSAKEEIVQKTWNNRDPVKRGSC